MVGTKDRIERYERQRNYGPMTGRQVRRVVRKGRQHGDACGAKTLAEYCYLWPGHEDDLLHSPHESYSFIWSSRAFWSSPHGDDCYCPECTGESLGDPSC